MHDVLVTGSQGNNMPILTHPLPLSPLTEPRFPVHSTHTDSQGNNMPILTNHQLIKTWYGPALMRPLSYVRGMRLLFGGWVRPARDALQRHLLAFFGTA